MDISDTLAPDSTQLDAVDLLGGPRTFTVTKVTKGKADQPVDVHLAEFPRVWRPGKSMRRVLAHCWGKETSEWIGRRAELYCDLEVQFGGQAVGGIRISQISHIDKVTRIPLLVSRGKSAMFTVEPLPDDAPTSAPVDEETVARLAELRAEWKTAGPERRAVIKAEVEALTKADADPDTLPDPSDDADPWAKEGES